ncbi:hypothetical protein F4780DRAFT_566343 [Xylariomycetidae sp. FL0641]|nr:hypothetical protein F4780DRAFT_566343 [Xylariomycetidae sp. FL0641]
MDCQLVLVLTATHTNRPSGRYREAVGAGGWVVGQRLSSPEALTQAAGAQAYGGMGPSLSGCQGAGDRPCCSSAGASPALLSTRRQWTGQGSVGSVGSVGVGTGRPGLGRAFHFFAHCVVTTADWLPGSSFVQKRQGLPGTEWPGSGIEGRGSRVLSFQRCSSPAVQQSSCRAVAKALVLADLATLLSDAKQAGRRWLTGSRRPA